MDIHNPEEIEDLRVNLIKLRKVKEIIKDFIKTDNFKKSAEESLQNARHHLWKLLQDDAYNIARENDIKPAYLRGMIAELMAEYIFCHAIGKDSTDSNAVYSNVMIPTGPNSHTQIDLVATYQDRIFVVECKSLYGNISITDNGVKTSSIELNPFKQNMNHVNHLRRLLGKQYTYIPVVYLFGVGKIKEDKRVNKDSIVMINNGALFTLKRLCCEYDEKEKISQDVDDILRDMEPSIDDEVKHVIITNCLADKLNN